MNSNTWNADGSLVNANQDFQASINDLEKTLDTTTDENERAKIKEQLRVLEAARNQKIDEQGLTYGKTYKYQSTTPTLARDEMNTNANVALQTLATDADVKKYGIAADMAMADEANQTDIMLQAMKNEVANAKASSGGKSSSSSGSVSGTKEENSSGVTIGKEGLGRLDKFVVWINENSGIRNTYLYERD